MSREVFHLGYLLVLNAVDPGSKFTICSVTLTTAPRRDTKDKILPQRGTAIIRYLQYLED